MVRPSRFACLCAFLFAFLCCNFALAQNSSTTALTAAPTTVAPGAGVTLSASVQVATGDLTPTGTVEFTVNGQAVASAPLLSGTASVSASSKGVAPGTYPVVANYGGDANTAPSHSSAVSVTISDYTSTTTLAIAQPTVARGQSATATATVTCSSGQIPTGTVTFYMGDVAFSTMALTNGTARLTGSSAELAAATYPVHAVYNGNAQTETSSSAVVDFTVKGVTTTAFAAAPPVVAPGGTTTLQVAVATTGGTAPTGTVQFYAGSTLLIHSTVTGGAASLIVPTSGYPAGVYTLTADYLGDAKNEPSSSTATVSLEATTPAFTITPAGAALATGGTAQFSVTPASSSKTTWYVNGVAGGSAATGTINSSGAYTAPSAGRSASVLISAAAASAPTLFSAPVPVYVVVPGSVGPSNNTEVAAYTLNAPAGGQMTVNFGPTSAYGRSTWTQATPAFGSGAARMLVAGMTAPATWHMSATVNFGNGLVYQDPDQTFTTALPFTPYSTPTVTLGEGMTPQPGFEMVNPAGNLIESYDLQGNFIWGLQPSPAGSGGSAIWQPIKMLPNGDLLTQFSPESAFPIDGSILAAGTTFAVYEMQLDGTIVKQVTLAQLNANLAASGYKDGQGNLPTLLDIHHDVTLNPVTGHWLMIANTTRVETDDPGTTGPTTILGDVLLDVDPNNNFKIDWVWNSFDNMDVTRHPMSITDWTHTNAIIYSADDHNILVSMRHQNWMLKLDYDDGTGPGTILWHFGYQGEFTLLNSDGSTDANIQDWNWAQHSPSFTTTNTTGTFGLTLMDNGDDRQFSPDATCPVALTNGACYYSRAPQFTVDETAMTVTLNTIMPYETYSFFGGNSEILPNGDAHADFCSVLNPTGTGELVGYMLEYTGGDNPQFVWSMDMNSTINAYRGQRWTSFYPGVTWTQ